MSSCSGSALITSVGPAWVSKANVFSSCAIPPGLDCGLRNPTTAEEGAARVPRPMPRTRVEMDEPTNHLDIESIVWLEHFLKSYDGAVLMTSHDREFVDRIKVSKVREISAGGVARGFSGDYDFYERERAIPAKPISKRRLRVRWGRCSKASYGPVSHGRSEATLQ